MNTGRCIGSSARATWIMRVVSARLKVTGQNRTSATPSSPRTLPQRCERAVGGGGIRSCRRSESPAVYGDEDHDGDFPEERHREVAPHNAQLDSAGKGAVAPSPHRLA